jgi:hypothetical protein
MEKRMLLLELLKNRQKPKPINKKFLKSMTEEELLNYVQKSKEFTNLLLNS